MSKPFIAAVVVLLCVAVPITAAAVEGELTLGLGPGFADLPARGEEGQDGFGAGAYAEYRFDYFWGTTVGAYQSYQLSLSEDDVHGQHITSIWAGVIYNLDVATWVPFATLSATAYISSPQLEDAEGNEVDGGMRLGVGVDWRRYRNWSLGAEVDLHAFLTDLQDYPVYITSFLRLNYHRELF